MAPDSADTTLPSLQLPRPPTLTPGHTGVPRRRPVLAQRPPVFTPRQGPVPEPVPEAMAAPRQAPVQQPHPPPQSSPPPRQPHLVPQSPPPPQPLTARSAVRFASWGVLESTCMEQVLDQGGLERQPASAMRDMVDGITAFAMTMVVAVMGIPWLTGTTMDSERLFMGVSISVMVFLVLASTWFHEISIFRAIEHADARFRVDTLAYVGLVSATPPCIAFATFVTMDQAVTGSVAISAVLLTLTAWQHRTWVGAVQRGLIDPALDEEAVARATRWSRTRVLNFVPPVITFVAASVIGGYLLGASAAMITYGIVFLWTVRCATRRPTVQPR